MIIENKILCTNCNDTIFSKHRHDYVTCSCGQASVDGGQSYLRRCGNLGNIIDMSWFLTDEQYEDCAEAVQAATESGRNKYGIANAVMRMLREHNCIVADGEQRIMARHPDLDEVMVVEIDGSINRYKKII